MEGAGQCVSGTIPVLPSVPPVSLCFGCLHSFPQLPVPTGDEIGMLKTSEFGEGLRRCLHQIRKHAARVEPLNDRSRESVGGMDDEMKRLVVIIDDELTQRKRNADKLSVQLKYYSDWEGQIQKQLRNVLEQQQQQQQRNSANANSQRSQSSNSRRFGQDVCTSHLLDRFISSARSAAPTVRPASGAAGESVVTNRYGAAISRVPRRPDGVPNYVASEVAASLPSMSARNRSFAAASSGSSSASIGRQKGTIMDESTLTIYNQVSASLYNILEGLAVTTRSAIAVLWLKIDDSGEELSAPFLVVGRNEGFARKGEGALPFRIGASSHTAGAVAAEGIACSVRRPAGSGAEETLQQALTSTVRSTLIVPVFKKFRATERVCDGSIQLIGWSHSQPFTQDDEYSAVSAATFITHIVSNYGPKFRASWCSRPPFDPSQLRRHAAYSAALDQAIGDVKDAVSTAAAVGHASGGTTIHRCDFGHTPVGSTKAIMRQQLTATSSSTLIAPKDAIRDLHRYTNSLEASWKSAMQNLSDTERRVTELQRQLDVAKQHGIIDGHRPRTAASAISTQAASMSPAASGREQQGTTRTAPSSAGGIGLTTMKLDELEQETKNRMRSAASVKRENGKSTVFLTES